MVYVKCSACHWHGRRDVRKAVDAERTACPRCGRAVVAERREPRKPKPAPELPGQEVIL